MKQEIQQKFVQEKRWLIESGSQEDVGNEPFCWLSEENAERAEENIFHPTKSTLDARPKAQRTDTPASSLEIDKTVGKRKPTALEQEEERIAARGEGGVDAREILKEKVSSCQNLLEVREVLFHEKLGVLREIQDSATNLVFTDGVECGDVLVIGEAPGRDEDRLGLPFVGRSGQLLDKMLASIGLSRRQQVLLTNVVYWRPPGNRNPSHSEALACSPVMEKTIELTKPKVILLTGSVPMRALLKNETTIGRVRGRPQKLKIDGIRMSHDVLVTFHPSYLLRAPNMKAYAWRDMLMLKKMLENLPEKKRVGKEMS